MKYGAVRKFFQSKTALLHFHHSPKELSVKFQWNRLPNVQDIKLFTQIFPYRFIYEQLVTRGLKMLKTVYNYKC